MIDKLYLWIFKNWKEDELNILFSAVPILYIPLAIEYLLCKGKEQG